MIGYQTVGTNKLDDAAVFYDALLHFGRLRPRLRDPDSKSNSLD